MTFTRISPTVIGDCSMTMAFGSFLGLDELWCILVLCFSQLTFSPLLVSFDIHSLHDPASVFGLVWQAYWPVWFDLYWEVNGLWFLVFG